MEPQTTSLLARQPSGIRALPSHDDDDDDDFDTNPVYENSNSVEEFDNFNEQKKNLNLNMSYEYNGTSSDSSSGINGSSSSSSVNNGSLVSVEEEFEEIVADPDEETLGKMVGIAQNDVSGSGSVVGSGSKASVPVAKVSGEGDDDENEVGSGEEDEAEGSYGVDKVVPRVRVLGEDDDEGEEWSESVEGPNVETPIGCDGVEAVEAGSGVRDEALGGKSGENASLQPEHVYFDGDAVIDSINVDVVEAVRSGVAVVGVDDKDTNEVNSAGEAVGKSFAEVVSSAVDGDGVTPSVVETAHANVVESGSAFSEDEIRKDPEVEVENEQTSVVLESGSVGSSPPEAAPMKYTDEGDAIVDSIKVDAAEAVRSGTAIVGEVGDVNDKEELEGSIAQNATPLVENTVHEQSASEVSPATEIGEVKSAHEADSVVDGIQVDVVEAIRSGVAVVGDPEVAAVVTEAREVVDPSGETMALGNEFAPLVSSNLSEIVNIPGEQQKAEQNDAVVPQSAETLMQPHTRENGPDTGIQVEQNETAKDLVSGPEYAEVQQDRVDVEPTKVDRSYARVLVDGLNAGAPEKNPEPELVEQTEIANPVTEGGSEDGDFVRKEEGDDEGSVTDDEDNLAYFGSGSGSRKIIEDLDTRDRSEMIDGQVVTDSEEEGDSDEEGEGKQLYDSAALAALLKAVSSGDSESGPITFTTQDGSRLFSVERPAGLGPSLRSARPTIGASNTSLFTPSNPATSSEENLSEDEKKKLQTIQQLKVKFLRLVQRLGLTAEHSLAAQVLYKLTIFGGRSVFPSFSLDAAKQTAMQLEAEGGDDLDFALNILVLGKSGVGKSAIINSIFGEEKVKINAFEPETTAVNEICGVVDGVKIRCIDVPGLKSSAMEQGFNRKVLASVKKLTKKNPADVMFYVDRLDSQTRDLNDLPLLKTITSSLGSSIWRNAIVTLTHASSAPPDGPSGTPLSYEVFVAQRSHIVQQSIGQAVGEMRLMSLNMMNPVSLVENHPACRKNREGQKILPNGQAWRPQLLLLCYSVKILSEASATSKSQDVMDPRKLFGFRTRSPPLPYLLSSLLQPHAHPKLSADQGGDNVDSDIDLDDVSDSDQEEEEDEYDQLPPFKPLRKAQMAKLSRDQRKAYFEEYDYRVKLLQRKQWREELKRMREMKKNGKSGVDAYGEMPEDYDGENGAPAAVPVPLPDMVLPPSFDSDNPAYRYRFLEPTSQFLARPVLDPHGWDHDCGYEGVNVEQNMGIAGRFPAAFTVQVTKDKKDFNIHLDSAVSAKHGDSGSSLVGFDVQTIGKQYAYIVRGESKFKNLKKNKTAAGVTVTFLGENVATGVKVEDQILLGKRLVLVGSTGTVRSQKDGAYGANLEVRLREADYPIGQEQSSFALSLMKWRGDLAVGANFQSQISLGRNTKTAVRVALNNKLSGQVTVRTSSSDHLSLALAGVLPLAIAFYRKFRPETVENYGIY